MKRDELPTPVELVRAMSAEKKLEVAHGLWVTATELMAAGIRARQPSLDEKEVRERVREVYLRVATGPA